jgi:serine/threonine-protein kinase
MEHALLNRQIDDFVIQEHIGYSALSILFRANQVSLNRPVILKVLGLDEVPLERATFLHEFMAQASIIMRIENLHILPLYAYGIVEDELAYIASRMMPQKLAELLHQRTPSLRRCAQWIEQIASGLDYANSRGVLHGTLSPGNIYLDHLQNVFVDDYEMSRVVQLAHTHEQLLRILGTPVYASPEQLQLQPITYRSDIYSLGAILYRMTTGREPYEMPSGSIPELIQMHRQKALVPPRKLNPDIPPAAEAAILKAMHEDPEQRFETALALTQAFQEAIQTDYGPMATRTYPEPIPFTEHIAQDLRTPFWMVFIVVLLIVTTLVAVFFLTRG